MTVPPEWNGERFHALIEELDTIVPSENARAGFEAVAGGGHAIRGNAAGLARLGVELLAAAAGEADVNLQITDGESPAEQLRLIRIEDLAAQQSAAPRSRFSEWTALLAGVITVIVFVTGLATILYWCIAHLH
jgi:hypothetical protein